MLIPGTDKKKEDKKKIEKKKTISLASAVHSTMIKMFCLFFDTAVTKSHAQNTHKTACINFLLLLQQITNT